MRSCDGCRWLSRRWVVGLLALSTSSLAVAGNTAVTSKSDAVSTARQIDAANGMLARGLYDLAEAEYRAALQGVADDTEKKSAQYGLAICIYRQNRFEDALAALKPLLAKKSFAYAAEVGFMHGQSLMALGQFDAAVDSFKRVSSQFREHKLASQAIVGAIEGLYRSGDNEAALHYARERSDRIKQDSVRNRAELFQAAAMLNLQDATGAAALLERLIERELKPSFASQVRVMLGQSALQSGAFSKAAKWYREVLAGESVDVRNDAWLGLADANYRLGELEASKREIANLLEAQPGDRLRSDATLLLGRINFDMGAFAEARKIFEMARELGNTNRIEAEYWIAKCALRMGSAREAVELFDRWNKVNSEHPISAEATYDHAVSLIEAEQFDDAGKVLGAFRSRFPAHTLDSAALHLLAVAAFRSNNDSRCIELCEAYLHSYPEGGQLAECLSLAGRSTLRAEKWKEAIRFNAKFAKRFADDDRATDAMFRAGLASYRMEEIDAAEKFFASLLDSGKMPDRFAVALLALGDIRFQANDWAAADRWLTAYLTTKVSPVSGDEALLKRGLARRQLDENAKALADFDLLLKRWPDSSHVARAHLQRGEILAMQGDEDAASAALATAVNATGSKDVSTHATFQQAVLAMRRGQYSDAAIHLTSYLENESDEGQRGEAQYQRGQCWLAVEAYDKAYDDFSGVSRLYRKHDRASDAAAWSFVALVRQDKFSEALVFWTKALSPKLKRLDGQTRATILYERAWALAASNEPVKALKAYEKVLDQPDADSTTRAHATLGLAEIEIEEDGCASGSRRLHELVANDQAAKSMPQTVRERALYRLGLCAIESQDWSQAQKLFATLLKDFPEKANLNSIHLYNGEALMQLGRHADAREQFEFVTNGCDDDAICPAAMLRLGECLSSQQQWALSERVFQDYLARFGNSESWYQAQFGLGWAREHQDRIDDAIDAYREVVDRHRGPSAARAQFQIGECFFANGKHEAAVREFLKVDILYDYPEWSAAALYETGRCFELLDRRVEARKHFKAVIERFGDSKWADPAAKRLPRLASSVVPGH